jgi:hypothetical protein
MSWGCVASVAVAAAGCDGRAAPPAPPRTNAAMVAAQTVTPAHLGRADAKGVRDFHVFALNFLLVPLLDDDVPDRWADPRLSMACDDADVRIDGAPPDVGAPVGTAPFTVRWWMQRCTTFDGPVTMTGSVELQVVPMTDGYTARVLPHALQVSSVDGVDVVQEPFTTRLRVER